jgi:hypothetical protein
MSKDKDIDFEDKLWKATDKLRKKVEVNEYKYVVLSARALQKGRIVTWTPGNAYSQH